MTRFWREGHWRAGIHGDHWVEGHWVDRTDWNRFSRPSTSRPANVFRQRLSFESFTNPNAHCPVCGDPVAFYQSPYGGKVFFNYLGWPWPKHECTDAGGQGKAASVVANRAASTIPLDWQIEGWIPIHIERILREDSWYVLKCKRLEDGALVRALVSVDPGDLSRVPATLSPWTPDGFATLSYLDDNGEPRDVTVCKYSEFCLLDPREVVISEVILTRRT